MDVSWLSIHRAERIGPSREERSYDYAVDSKLDSMSNEFVRYFSLLKTNASYEMSKFQEKVFLSLIDIEKRQQLIPSIKKMDLVAEEKALIDIFNKFNLAKESFADGVDAYFNLLKQGLKQLKEGKGLGEEHLIAVVGTYKIHALVNDWNKIILNQERIYGPRDNFLKTINSLFIDKELRVNEQNELIAEKASQQLNFKQLSSGEKQLIIILGEALLQQKKPIIYIADEPELSLHIEWQAKLIDSVRTINPNTQIIFATHSPDIVGEYGKRTFNMEKILK